MEYSQIRIACAAVLFITHKCLERNDMIKAVVFDMDGLMIDTEKLLLKYWLEAAHQLGFPMEREHVFGIRSLAREYAIPKLKQELGDDFDYDAVRTLRMNLMNEYIREHGVEEKPGLGTLLEYLKSNGYQTAVATATDMERTTWYLTSINRFQYFDRIISAKNVAHGKPAPDIYIEATRQIGRVPEECLALEDSPNGILSAYRAGLHPVMVPDLTQPDKDTRKLLYACVETLADVVLLLEKDKRNDSES